MEKQTYIIGPAVAVGKKKERKRSADMLAKQLMKLLAEDYDVIEIVGYKCEDGDLNGPEEIHDIPA